MRIRCIALSVVYTLLNHWHWSWNSLCSHSSADADTLRVAFIHSGCSSSSPESKQAIPLLQMCFHFLEAFTRVCDVYTHTYVRSTRWKRCGKYFRKWQQKAGSFAGPNFISIKIWRGKRDECVRETDRDQASEPPQLLSCCLPAVVCTMRHRQEFGGALTRAAHGVDRYGK